ncbi:hypothetical protein [Halanaerobium saccharolyticum]|nr:hypothetical protein [Halanaerobium saccharolyticum]
MDAGSGSLVISVARRVLDQNGNLDVELQINRKDELTASASLISLLS